MRIVNTLRAALVLVAALFALTPDAKAIDLTVDLGSFSPMQAQGLRDTYMSKKAAQCINVNIASLATSSTPTTVIPWSGTVVHLYTSLGAAITENNEVRFYNNSLSTLMGSLTMTGSGSAIGDVDEVSSISNATVTAEGFIGVYSQGQSTSAVPATATICIQPSDATVGRP